ncbi:MAG: hypothetical protein A2636_04710 [Elusimicrobia bacterium RIFCSPHIGHO2_01_FULL_64_10]|nr:MAG: hypothetical protein A2636_04710 [Elusimicrobia bacterium RIFCSPHIGHO2_01_FULL_64_10]
MEMNCERAGRLISEAMDRRLSWRERLALKLHLFLCGMCVQYDRQLETLAKLARTLGDSLLSADGPRLGEAAKRKIIFRLRSL